MSHAMKNRRRHLVGVSALMTGAAVALAGLSMPALGQEAARKPAEAAQATQATQPGEKLPSAEEVLKKYVEATGGVEAYEALKTQHAAGTFSAPEARMEGKFELFQEQPDKFLALVTLPGMGEIQTGLNGKKGWRVDWMQGPRLLEGEELKSLTRDADMQAVLKPQDHYDSMEVKGIEEVNGEKAYHLVFVPKGGGNAIDAWYSVESGLQLMTASTQETPMGQVRFENQLQDYKAIGEDGKLKQPHKIVTTGGNTKYIVTLDKIDTNIELPADRFDPPAEVKQLMEQEQAATQN